MRNTADFRVIYGKVALSNMAHIVGGVIGGLLGYGLNRKSGFER
ncbi:MAG: hypothetical protein Q4B72_11575 [Lachnospiraceae bacterium]|nr:hypothetical protein [Lachnospiraceae bacterium]